MCPFLHGWSLGFLQPSCQSVVFKPTKGTCLPSAGWGAQYVVQTPPSPGRICKPMISPSSSLSLPRDVSLDLIASPPFLPDSLWIFLYSLGCQRVFLPVSSLFSVRIYFHVDVLLMCLWGEVSSAPSYSTILISSPTHILFVTWHNLGVRVRIAEKSLLFSSDKKSL